jgi:hypothetical protein
MLDHVEWENDSLLVKYGLQKGDQEGKTTRPKHIHANPENPFICPILALAVYIFSMNFRRDDGSRLLFGGSAINVEKKFGEWLKEACKSAEEHFIQMGHLIAGV